MVGSAVVCRVVFFWVIKFSFIFSRQLVDGPSGVRYAASGSAKDTPSLGQASSSVPGAPTKRRSCRSLFAEEARDTPIPRTLAPKVLFIDSDEEEEEIPPAQM